MTLLWSLLCFAAGVIAGISYVNQPWKKLFKYWIWHEHTWIEGCSCTMCDKLDKENIYRHCADCNETQKANKSNFSSYSGGWGHARCKN